MFVPASSHLFCAHPVDDSHICKLCHISNVDSHVELQDASAPGSANLSGNSTPLRSASFYQTRMDGRTSDSAPDISASDMHTDSRYTSFEERSGFFRSTVNAMSDGILQSSLTPAAGPHPSTPTAAALMLRPASLFTAGMVVPYSSSNLVTIPASRKT